MGRSDNTIDKYKSDYNRFFAGYPIEKMDIRKINDETIAKHLTKVLSGGQIRWRALSDKDMKALLNKLHHPIAHNTNIMANFAIELAVLTGMRVGEISALMWEDIFYSDNVIYIHHSEKYNRVSKEYYVSLTKNGSTKRIIRIILLVWVLVYR